MLPHKFSKKKELETRVASLKAQLRALNSGESYSEGSSTNSQAPTEEADNFYPALDSLDEALEGNISSNGVTNVCPDSQQTRLNFVERKMQDLSRKLSEFVRSKPEQTVQPLDSLVSPPRPIHSTQGLSNNHNNRIELSQPPNTNIQSQNNEGISSEPINNPNTRQHSQLLPQHTASINQSPYLPSPTDDTNHSLVTDNHQILVQSHNTQSSHNQHLSSNVQTSPVHINNQKNTTTSQTPNQSSHLFNQQLQSQNLDNNNQQTLTQSHNSQPSHNQLQPSTIVIPPQNSDNLTPQALNQPSHLFNQQLQSQNLDNNNQQTHTQSHNSQPSHNQFQSSTSVIPPQNSDSLTPQALKRPSQILDQHLQNPSQNSNRTSTIYPQSHPKNYHDPQPVHAQSSPSHTSTSSQHISNPTSHNSTPPTDRHSQHSGFANHEQGQNISSHPHMQHYRAVNPTHLPLPARYPSPMSQFAYYGDGHHYDHVPWQTSPYNYSYNVMPEQHINSANPLPGSAQNSSNNNVNPIEASSPNLSSLSSQATMALTAITAFSGDKKDRSFNDFKRELQQVLSLYVTKKESMNNTQYNAVKALCLKTRLSGAALRFVSNLPDEVEGNFNAILSSLQERFSPPANISILRNELSNLDQGELSVAELEEKINTLVHNYARADTQLAQYSPEQKSAVLDNLKRQALHVSLKAEIFDELTKLERVNTYDEMIQFAKQIEMNNKVIKARNEKPKAVRVAKIMASGAAESQPTQAHCELPGRPRQAPNQFSNFQSRPYFQPPIPRWNCPPRMWRQRLPSYQMRYQPPNGPGFPLRNPGYYPWRPQSRSQAPR